MLAISALMVTAGCGGGFPLGALGLSDEDLEAFGAAQADFNQQIESLPSITVRIINETSAIARVELASGASGPEFPIPEGFEGIADPFAPEEPFLQSIDSQVVLVAPGGTVSGPLKCGEVIGISATVPADAESFGFGTDAFGLFISSGNIALSGIGEAAQRDFSGDTVGGARFVRPGVDGIVCRTDTLVVRIESPASETIYNPETGELLAGGSPGAGTLSIE